tara:strand:+ start:70 stop:387 length:318 start_codon:yes stop_codon:yes gene_type:complete
MNDSNRIPAKLLSMAKRLNPNAAIPTRPGEGVITSSFFLRSIKSDNLFYFGTAKTYDGRLYLVHNANISKPFPNALANIVLQSQFLFVDWDKNGAIDNYAAGQQK